MNKKNSQTPSQKKRGKTPSSTKQETASKAITKKTINNTDVNKAKDQVSDLEIFGNGDTFKLLAKASSKNEDWFKSTKAMHIAGRGCVVQVTTYEKGEVAEALTFVPNVKINETKNEEGTVIGRNLVSS